MREASSGSAQVGLCNLHELVTTLLCGRRQNESSQIFLNGEETQEGGVHSQTREEARRD